MIFETDYWHAMDRRAAENLNISPAYIGISTPPMKGQVEGLRGKIFAGAKHIELGFMGRGKGSLAQGATTPEMHSKEEREAIRHMAKINEVNLTTHATANAQGFAGLTEQGFKEEVAEANLHEVERAIDFAADTTNGGPVVVHTGEFPIEIGKYKEFEAYPGEREKAPIYLADEKTGQIIPLRKDTEIAYPKGGFDSPERNPDGTIIWETRTIKDFEKEAAREGVDVGKFFYDRFMRKELELNKGEERRWAISAKEQEGAYEHVNRAIKSVEEQAKINPEQAKYSAIRHAEEFGRMVRGGTPIPGSPEYEDFLKNPVTYLRKTRDMVKGQIDSLYEISRSYGSRAEEMNRQLGRIKPIEEVGIKKSADTLARAALFAYDTERARKLEKPLFIAPENIFPEGGYGAHPQELKNLIIEAREAMTEKLQAERRISRTRAEKIAADHIKATFDIGHAYTWKKFFPAKPGENPEETDRRFNEWLGKQVDDLNKEGIIGHVHLSDNFGYYDEHVTPGEGKAPIQDFLKRMKEAKYKEPMIVEPSHQDYLAWTGAMRNIGSPIYRVDRVWQTWTDIEGSYFGQTRAPYYVFGAYAPDYGAPEEMRNWVLWSRVQLE